MTPIPVNQQQALVDRLTRACGGAYSPETRRKHFITGPQWAASYEGHALFHAPTRKPVNFEDVIAKYAAIGIGHWCTHDTDVIPTDAIGTARQDQIVGRIKDSLRKHGLKCSMVTTETFHHAVWAGSPAAESPQVREYAKAFAKRVAPDANTPADAAVRAAYPIALARDATEQELRDAVAFITEQSASYAAAGRADARDLALADFCQSLMCWNEFVYVE